MSFPQRSPAALSREGRHARDRGDPERANPYPEGSEEHETWARGWRMPDGEIGHETTETRQGRGDPPE